MLGLGIGSPPRDMEPAKGLFEACLNYSSFIDCYALISACSMGFSFHFGGT